MDNNRQSDLTALDPAIAARVQASFDRQGLMAHLGAQLTGLAQGWARITLPYRPELTQQLGYFHAGATSAIADSAGGYAAFTLFPAETSVLTVEFKMNLISPAIGTRLEATGHVIKPGRSLTICRLDVEAIEGESRKLIAIGQQTLIRVDKRGE